MIQTKHYVIKGVVQGVFFRFNAKRKADELGLSGWVKNRVDGSVEIVIQGPGERVRDMVNALKKGFPGSKVDSVIEQEKVKGRFPGFSML